MKERAIKAWPEWTIGECIGKGGFGAVYEMRRDVFGDIEKSALKVISIPTDNSEIEYMKSEGLDEKSISQVFHSQVGEIIKEYKLMKRMSENTHIVHCDDFKYVQHPTDPGWDIYIKMELLTPLMNVLNRMQDEKEIIRLGIDLCDALKSCQKHNIIHRDIKPQNIFISPEGNFKLGDFGIARMMENTSRAQTRTGTLNFMAPEVVKGSYTSTVDIYSLGLVLYWLLNERRGPFLPLPPTNPSYAMYEKATYRRFSGEQLPPPKNGSESLQAVVMKACSYNPEERYRNAEEMMDALKAISKKQTKRNTPNVERIKTHDVKEDEKTITDSKSIDLAMCQNTEKQTHINSTDNKRYQIKQTKDRKIDNTVERVEPGNTASIKKKTIIVAAIAAVIAVVLGTVAGMKMHSPEKVNTAKPVSVQNTEAVPMMPEQDLEMESDANHNILMESESGDEMVFGQSIARRNVGTITFLDTVKDAPADAWDVSLNQDKRVLAWTKPNGQFYDLYIAGEGGVKAPDNCTWLFCNYLNLREINFNNCFDTSETRNMAMMFRSCRELSLLDVAEFNTANVWNMSEMFYDCRMLSEVDVSGFDTSNVTMMNGMFSWCSSLSDINVSGFDTSKVKNMYQMFFACENLTSLDIDCWDLSSVEQYDLFMVPNAKINGRRWKEYFEK